MSARWPKLSTDGTPTQGVVLLDVDQGSCAPSRALEPRLEAFARRHPGDVRVMQIDIDQDPDAAQRYGVQSLPTLLLFAEGRKSRASTGSSATTTSKRRCQPRADEAGHAEQRMCG
jgi:thiol-disulfide isomerase/thioredoxin